MSVSKRQSSLGLTALALAVVATPASAITFDLDFGSGLHGTLNSVMTGGAQMRTQDRSQDLLGKSNINPNVCGNITSGPHAGQSAQSCQGLFKDQNFPAQTLVAAPGAASNNNDDGDWNYHRGQFTQAPVKVVEDFKLTYGDYGLFTKWYWFYDFVNENFTEHHNNMLTAANYNQAGCTAAPPAGCNSNGPAAPGFQRTYGPGLPVAFKRTDGELLKQVGTDIQPFDLYLFGNVPLWGDRKMTAKLGRQTVNWGESTVLVINSINQANPVNANNLGRVGFDLSELFVPTGKLFLSTELFENATVEGFYGYEWKPIEIPAPGSFYSFIDVGTNNIGDSVGFNFSGPAEDPEFKGSPTNNPLSGLTPTTTQIHRLRDHNAKDSGQYGLAFKYFADWLNHGTQLGLYMMNYHSQLPYVSFYSTTLSCARANGVHGAGYAQPTEFDATNGLELLQNCPDLPILHAPGGTNDQAHAATSDAVPLDHVKLQLEYPENLKMFGVSFNTTVGDISMQGELAYRPKMPLQVATVDLAFLAMAPGLTNCSDPTSGQAGSGCTGTNLGGVVGVHPTTSDYTPYPGQPAGSCSSNAGGYCDTFDLVNGHADSSARSFPSFVGVYRGYAPGQFPSAYDSTGKFLGEGPSNPGYIRGWQDFDVYQLNIGGTYVQGATDNPIGADQLIWLFETGAQYVPGLPSLDTLQIQAPGAYYHASAGADGSMTGNYKQDCAGTPDCNYGPDGLRFNPHQQDRSAYATNFSAGYAIVSLMRYESVFPGISFAPLTLFKHDVIGNSTDVASQFVRGRKQINLNFEIRYKEALSIVPGYNWFFGGKYNLLQDRDNAQMYIKYQF